MKEKKGNKKINIRGEKHFENTAERKAAREGKENNYKPEQRERRKN